jgi:hypothetical protein
LRKVRKSEDPKKGGIFLDAVSLFTPYAGVPASILGGGQSIFRSILRRAVLDVFGVFEDLQLSERSFEDLEESSSGS